MSPSDPAHRLEKDLECPATAVVTTSLDGRILAWNTGAEKVWGYTAQEVVGKHISILEHPRSRAVVPAIGEIARNGKALRPKRALGRGKDGRTRIVALSAVPVVDQNGDVSAVNATVHDLTQERRKEEMGHRLVDIFMHTQVGVCVANPSSQTLEMVNPAFARMHGYEPDELAGRPVVDLFPSDRRDEVEACLRAAQENGRHSLETEHVRRDGTRFPILIDVTCVRGPDGAVRHFVADVHDISRVVRAEKRAHQSDELNLTLERRVAERTAELTRTVRELEAFAYTVAHDLRAPLRAMYGFADLLVQESEPSPAASEHARRVREAAGHMDQLITDLLAYARHANTEVHPTPVPLERILDRALERWRDRVSQGEIELATPPPLPTVLGNEAILVEAVAQLVDNALKFVRPGEPPRVRISSERRGGAVRLTVEDRGIGIAPEHRDRIFGIFERLNRAEAYPGTGIGLAIVRKGIERLGGHVGLESELGKGSRFWIELPEA